MSATRIHRYIIREIAVPTAMALFIFTFVILMGRMLKLVEMVLNKGIPLLEIARLFAYLMPAFLVITVPLSFLLGVMLGFGRLSGDSEIIAIKTSGVSLYGMMKPVVILAVVASLMTGALTLFAAPASNTAFRNQVFEIASKRASVGIRPRIFNADFDGLVLYTENIDDRSGVMDGIFISDERGGATPAVILARRGRVISDSESLTLTLRLENGSIHRSPREKEKDTYQVVNFAGYDINLNMGEQLTSSQSRIKKDRELSMAELSERYRDATTDKARSAITVERHNRFILPLAPLIFALIGVPLGIQSNRSGKGGGFALALAVFLAYYILYSLAKTLAVESGFPPVPTVWTPTVLFLLGGGYLLHHAATEQRLKFLDRLSDAFFHLTRRSMRRK
jgi:lipopolysaccharide export system permease protein